MRKSYTRIFVALAVVSFASCSRDENETTTAGDAKSQQMYTPAQINAEIERSLKSTGDFNWKTTSDSFIWSAASNGDFIISVGFGNNANDFDRSKLPDNRKIENELLALIADYEGVDQKDFLILSDPTLTTFDVIVKKQATISALRKSGKIRYVEPANYRFTAVAASLEKPKDLSTTSSGVADGSGCGFDALTLSAADYTTVSPNARASWSLYQHNVPTAWSLSSGSGVTIGIIDTGVSPEQTLLGSSFNTGLSSGRTIQKFGVYVDSAWPWSTTTDGSADLCGHGTSMASAAAAPRNNAGLPVGVAYNANLVTYRAAKNVVLDGYHEQEGVKKAFTDLGNNPNVKIISMSMGHLFSVGKISDAIKFAYNKGKLILSAAGTSTSYTTFVGVIFPATMAEVVAVTGVKEGSYTKCDDCHTGDKVEFTVAMQRASSGNTVPVVSYYNGQSDYVGGSSVATATTAGIAALVWARYPSWTRTQVLSRMRSSAYFYPNKNSEFGYGNINAALAVQ